MSEKQWIPHPAETDMMMIMQILEQVLKDKMRECDDMINDDGRYVHKLEAYKDIYYVVENLIKNFDVFGEKEDAK